MKRKIGIISLLLIIVIVIILAVLLTNKIRNKQVNTEGTIAYMYQSDDGKYVPGSSIEWTKDDYILDLEQSNCNDTENSKLDWDANSNEVLLIANKRTNCTLYFDKMSEQEKFFQNLLGESGDGSLLYHNSLLTNGAEDNGYRYSGNNPNNFICFGPGSESYNNGQSEKCDDKNLYRIIGYVLVELQNGKKEYRIKVIKSEYATHDDLEKDSADGTRTFNSSYIKLKRVKNAENIDSFHWDDSNSNTWSSSTLYSALNGNEKSFLHQLGTDWQSKIEEVEWNVGGYYSENIPKAREVYDDERNKSYGAMSKVKAKIGLIYLSDYGFASDKENWKTKLVEYSIENNRENNWLFNAVFEWTISPHSGYHDATFNVDDTGYVDLDNVARNACVVRPVFYLNSSVTLSGGENIDGSANHPYRVN